MAKIVQFTAGNGVSFKDKNENWYKVSCELTVTLDEGDDFDTVKKKTWNTVQVECENQITDIMNNK